MTLLQVLILLIKTFSSVALVGAWIHWTEWLLESGYENPGIALAISPLAAFFIWLVFATAGVIPL